ncbi:DUF3667 domain-containing protein [Chryseobacterium chendengshani]|uniref:DUF3667 domain-containing protein n=1 Tax=Chryseobacterium sp. LJ668 TaxID=2864040 RepID=UPI001C68B1F8|nr:DUF3667 domain-containing protein [Chryseobacterium sp. LJ668]MBW8523724.1 DUF3667 domain-containing protein [Chryseobacterium sp. LJ668]QYK16668.1 DUF3667 domain-containing protein [Chryseobacterium sp. LJ668]
MIKCKNCGNLFEGKYCNQCGQSAKTKRINYEFLWEDIQHGLLHYDKGISYSLKKLFEKPGYIIEDYIEGKRINHFRPISMVIIMATIYALIYHLLDLNHRTALDDSSGLLLEKVFEHYYWFVVSTIPIYALTTFMVFKKTGYNFYEFIIFEAFKTSQRLLVHILFLPILYFLKDKSGFNTISNLLLIIDFILIFWTNKQFFNQMPSKKVLLKSVLSYLLYLVFAIVSVSLIIFAFGYD